MKTISINPHLIFFLLLLTGLFSSCKVTNQHYYIPPTGNILAIEKKNDIRVLGNISLNESSIRNLQVGYSPLNHLGLMGGILNQRDTFNHYPFSFSGGKHLNTFFYKYAAIGGYFFKEKKNYLNSWVPNKYLGRPGFLFDTYVGYGSGKIIRDYITFRSDVTMEFHNPFIQVGVHYRMRIIGVGGVLKYTEVNYTKLEMFVNPLRFPPDAFAEIVDNNLRKALELSLKFEYGIKCGKLNFNHTLFQDLEGLVDSKRSYTSVGVLLSINELFKISKKKPD